MKKIFYPQNVAVIGVSENPSNLARNIVQNLQTWQYKGEIYPVGPKGGEVFGLKIYPSVLDIPEDIDLAAVLTPAVTIPQIIEECGQKGITKMCISSGGFAEFDDQGGELTKLIVEKARKYNIRFVGPNGIAVINAENGLCLPFPLISKSPVGKIGVMTQSGGVGLSILLWLAEENLYINKFVSLGNKVDLNEVDFMEYFNEDPNIEVIIMYLESIEKGKKFIEVAKNAKKPILIYKGNTTQTAQFTAQSHTAALTNDNMVVEAAIRQAKIVPVKELSQLAEMAKMFSLPKIKGNRLVAISPAGGYTVVAADQGEINGFNYPPLSAETKQEMEKYSRAGVIRLSNPLDLGDTFSSEAVLKAIEGSFKQKDVDGVVVIFLIREKTLTIDSPAFKRRNIIPDMEELITKYKKPLVLSLVSNAETLSLIKKTVKFPIIPRPQEAFEMLGMFRDYWRKKEEKEEFVDFEVKRKKVQKIMNELRASGNKRVPDLSAFAILDAYGIKTVKPELATNIKEAVEIAEKQGFPVVAKIYSPDILHKTEVGGVKVNLRSKIEVKKAYNEILKEVNKRYKRIAIPGVLIYKMVPSGEEVILGVKYDPCFEHIIVFGLGGILVEVLADVSLRVAPISVQDAERMIREIKGYKVLKGVRGKKGVDIKRLQEYILRLSLLVSDFPEIRELDINPLIALPEGKGCWAVDVRMMIEV